MACAYPGARAAQLGLPWTLIPDPHGPARGRGEAGTFFYCLLSFNSQGGDSGSFPQLPTRNKAQRQEELVQGHRALGQSGRLCGEVPALPLPRHPPQLQSNLVPPIYDPTSPADSGVQESRSPYREHRAAAQPLLTAWTPPGRPCWPQVRPARPRRDKPLPQAGGGLCPTNRAARPGPQPLTAQPQAGRPDGAVPASVSSPGGWGWLQRPGGSRGTWVPAAPPPGPMVAPNLPATLPSAQPTGHGQGEKLRPRVRSGCQETEAARRVWPGSGRCTHSLDATLPVTRSS